MIKIKVCDVAPRSACSYYRGIGPLQKLKHINPEISVEYIEKVSWSELNNCDILFLMRSVESNYIEALELAQSFGVPVWIDYDDCLHEIPADNPSYEYYTQKHIIENIDRSIKYADIITFSTVALKEYYNKVRPDSIVIENAFNDYNYQLTEDYNDTKIISWRGSNTHRKDLLSKKDEMINVGNRFPDWYWSFIGCTPWYITDYIKNSEVMENIEIIRYNRLMLNLKPALHIIPLVDSVFNRSKSNIAWMEGVASGAACLCPSLPEFVKPGAVNYTDNNFEYLFEKLLKSRQLRSENFELSREYIRNNLLLSQINLKRLNIIEGLLK